MVAMYMCVYVFLHFFYILLYAYFMKNYFVYVYLQVKVHPSLHGVYIIYIHTYIYIYIIYIYTVPSTNIGTLDKYEQRRL